MTQTDIKRITKIKLNEADFLKRSSEIELERHRALSDLLAENSFDVQKDNMFGPYHLELNLIERHLHFQTLCTQTQNISIIEIPLSPFKKIVRDYFMICEVFYDTAKKGLHSKLEAIDMARRGLHDEGAEILRKHIKNKITLDKQTSRRLFTLICILHIRIL